MNEKKTEMQIANPKEEASLPKATNSGELDLNGFILSCAVLEDGTRVFSERSLANAFGIKGGGAYWEKKKLEDVSAVLPEYLSAKYLQPFITSELTEKLSGAFSYIAKSGTVSRGVDATILPDICDVYIEAKNKGLRNQNLIRVADTAYVLIKGFAKVGIIALIDEATGYQYERERDELQKILKMYVAEELRPWTKTFQDVFYKEIFRLNGWEFTASSIKKRPGVIGRWTNDLVYDQLPKGVLKELKNKTPKSLAGNYTARLFQSLTSDIGDPSLQAQINSVITLMQISDKWEDFMSRFKRLVQRRSGQLEVDFEGQIKDQSTPLSRNDFNTGIKGLLSVPPPQKDKQ